MSDDTFWSASKSTVDSDRSYSEMTPGGVVRAAMYSSVRMPRSTRASGKAQVFASAPKKMQSPSRLAAPAKGKLMLRSKAQRYKATGFMARPSKSTTAGSASLPLRTLKSANQMPDNFCYTPSELTMVRDQKSCGCCWAVSSTSMIADRVLVASNYRIRCALSAVQFMECSDYTEGSSPVGCEGNDPFTALQTLKDKPVYLLAEPAYPRKDYTQPTSANDCSSGGAEPPAEFAVTASDAYMVTKEIPEDTSQEEKAAIISENVENMKQSIYNEGPLVVVFCVPDDFKDYDGNTIYQAPEGFDPSTSDAWHAVEMVGWGKDEASGQSYWVCRNSWGDKWPVQHKKCNGMGFFYIVMGKNECAIEAYAAAITPKIINPGKAPKTPNNVYPGESMCTATRGFWSTPAVGPVTWGEIVLVAAVAGAGYYLWNNHKKTGKWLPEFVNKILS